MRILRRTVVSGDVRGGSVFRVPLLFRSGLVSFFFFISLLLDAALWGIVFFAIGLDERMIVLRYNTYFGIDLTGSPWQAFLVPCMTTIFFAINTILIAFCLRRGDAFLSLLLSVGSFFLHISALIAVFSLVMVN
jgi:hypothetical protein